MNNSYLIDFNKLGDSVTGYISVGQNDELPFEIKRVFWTYDTPEVVTRGLHCHYKTEQILIAVNGRITVNTECADGEIKTFVLDRPNLGAYIPPGVWHTMQYSQTSVLVVMTSTLYDENDYIRDYNKFREVWKTK